MIYYVLVRKGWEVKKIQCRNIEKLVKLPDCLLFCLILR